MSAHRRANRHRGEIEADLGGRRYRLCLTLGALAELETAFGAEDLLALAERFETGRLRARDCVIVIAAGLRGAGHDLSDDEVAALPVDCGATGYARIVGDLLAATFAGPDEVPAGPEHQANPWVARANDTHSPGPMPFAWGSASLAWPPTRSGG